MSSNPRREAIVDIINNEHVGNQAELAKRLKERGYFCTQATISRDLRVLKIVKEPVAGENYRYRINSEPEENESPQKFSTILSECVLGVDYANNLVVIHTIAGLAGAAGAAIDQNDMPDKVGCVAGDDTVLVVMRTEESAASLYEMLRGLCK